MVDSMSCVPHEQMQTQLTQNSKITTSNYYVTPMWEAFSTMLTALVLCYFLSQDRPLPASKDGHHDNVRVKIERVTDTNTCDEVSGVFRLAPSYLQERTYAFRKLLVALSQMLTESELTQIEYLYSLPQASTRKREGLDVLMELQKRGMFSPINTEPLIRLLQEIKRYDIAEHVGDYKEAYPGPTLVRKGGWSHG